MQITKARLREIIKEEVGNIQTPEETLQTPAPQSYRGFQIDIPSQDEEGNMISEELNAVYVSKLQDVIDSFYL